MGRYRTSLQSGLSTVELLVTLVVAGLFISTGYILYTYVLQDSGTTRADARATAVTNEYLDQYRTTSGTCTPSTLFDEEVEAQGLSNVSVTVASSCPDPATEITKITVTVKYGNPQKSIEAISYSRPDTSSLVDYHIGSSFAPAAPTTPIFHWPAVAGANNYDLKYSVNGAPFVTVTPTGQTTTTWTYNNTELFRNDTITLQVTAKDGSTEISTSTPTKVKIPKWIDCEPLQNGWLVYGDPTFGDFKFTKTKAGIVFFNGLIAGGSVDSNLPICTLPVGFRPTHALLFRNITNTGVGRVYVRPDGQVRLGGGGNGWASLGNINFVASGSMAAANFTVLSLLNSWTAYGDAWPGVPYDTLRSTVDSPAGPGRVHIQGLIRAGTNSAGTAMASIPVTKRSDRYLHQTTDTSGAGGVYMLDQIYYLDNPYTYQSVQLMYYPAGVGSWTNMTLQNGWEEYSAYYRPQYTKATDGVVTLRGLVKGGTTGCVTLTNLPAGYRPLRRQLSLGYEASYSTMRVDVDTNGDVWLCSAANTYNALDNISFVADQ